MAVIGGGLVGTETSKFISSKGVKVHIIEVLDAIAKDIGATYVGHLFKTIAEKGVEQHLNAKILEINDDEIVLEDKALRLAVLSNKNKV